MSTDNDKHKQLHESRAQARAEADNAVNLIRQKLDDLYEQEPDALKESKEAVAADHRSKHQKFMYELSQSGKSLADIQTAWHNYYADLNDKQKQEVWDEFYASNNTDSHLRGVSDLPTPAPPEPKVESAPRQQEHHTPSDYSRKTVAQAKQHLISKASAKKKLTAKQHIKSLAFGLGLGVFVVFILLFGFFNERFIAPFITPSKKVSSTPIIAADLQIASTDPEIIIPKINVQIPVIYDVKTIEEHDIQNGLERGVVHYATTSSPGEKGNVVIFGHSSNNIFNPGKYKFAFTLLGSLDNGDTFYLTKNKKLYVYKVIKKEIVQPNDVSVLQSTDNTSTATLITCDPPGTSLHRLVVTAEQVSPKPSSNVASTAVKQSATPTMIPSNAPSLWNRIWGWFSS